MQDKKKHPQELIAILKNNMKYYGTPTVTFSEFPDEIALNFSISGCPNHCIGCSEPELAEDIGEELTLEAIEYHMSKNPGISLVGFQGGDQDHSYIKYLAEQIKQKHPKILVGMYSGRDYLDLNLIEVLDYYKIGAWRMFHGDVETWKNQTAGPICLPVSNQIIFKKDGDKFVNITDKFRKDIVNNWKSVII